MRQQTFADEGFEGYRKPTRWEQFLGEMDQIIPWREWCGVIEPFYPKPAFRLAELSGVKIWDQPVSTQYPGSQSIKLRISNVSASGTANLRNPMSSNNPP